MFKKIEQPAALLSLKIPLDLVITIVIVAGNASRI